MRRIKHRLTLIYTFIIGVFALFLGIYISYLIQNIYIDALEKRLFEEINMITTIISLEDRYDFTDNLEEFAKELGEDISTRITLINTKGEVLADSQYDKNKMENHLNRPEVLVALSGKVGKEIRYSDTLGIDMLYLASPLYKDNNLLGVIRLALPLHEIRSSIKGFWYNLILALTIVFLITIFISTKLTNRITQPLEHITEIARKITKKDYSERLDINREDEIGQLGRAINIMADSLENQMKTIHENEKKLSTVLNNMSSGVILIDKNGIIIFANPAVEWLIGVSENTLIGKYHYEVGKQESISELIERAINNKESIHTEIGIYYPTKKYLDANVVPILDSSGEINNVLVLLIDITKIKRLEKMRTEFVANVSHELRTPITAVKGFTETLLDGTINDEDTRRTFLQIIHKESDRLHRLISDLLDLTKIEQNKEILNFSKVDLKSLIQSTIATMRPQIEKNKISIYEELDEVQVEADEDRLRQVMINLINNGIAYTPENGSITVRLYQHNKDFIKIEVEDTGIGIPEKSLPRIFERFYRVDKARSRESGGTGLGLAIVKHIIESHGGSIHVESRVGKGSKFTIIFPKKKYDIYET
ncbi:hypothetical protein BHF71_06510 [Vulcanibacillus modesticaldus]|uniref:histidine kinase n=1 Tax=Vulcanibacillus modesticaldus TaxID=337097 RepID=A0A1D2YWQ2_9BACI|nr:ATP-binding protein [Vulcanibacillus modesticaldus]OEG00092.1 hypothetical protein BHF71_06510 [Vulcanibacillus modesticaldus]